MEGVSGKESVKRYSRNVFSSIHFYHDGPLPLPHPKPISSYKASCILSQVRFKVNQLFATVTLVFIPLLTHPTSPEFSAVVASLLTFPPTTCCHCVLHTAATVPFPNVSVEIHLVEHYSPLPPYFNTIDNNKINNN